ncbi:MAG: glycosyl hydrolase [Erythrobacter sp.]|uniref:WD40/YVTN/BNR-like repeat-containing protein n=1 Tax=Erythrobacter sp. TaxID=1042 RepID=UPI00262E171D|nr:glycosyl hydrolase [Erythrobacter sp.]MDJ0978672.1 glycosyl hydrolase [Erythrobacter sp.]
MLIGLGLAISWVGTTTFAQDNPKASAEPAQAEGEELPEDERAYFAALKWRNVGPERGGRSISGAGSVTRPNEYYFASAGGGVWKTTDGGTSWKPVSDGQMDTAALGGIAVCESDPDTVYATTGETQIRGNIQPGNGVWKTTDAGKTWSNVGLAEVRNFSRVRIHPEDCDTVYVGGFGHYGVPNEDRGVFKTNDGGESWQKVLYRDERTGAVDISIDPNDPETIYAALWEAYRKPWSMSSGGPGSGLFRSTDGGQSWDDLTRAEGMPQEGVLGKIGVSVSPVDASRVYAIVEHEEAGGVYISDDAGESWRRTNDSRSIRQRSFYYSRLVADPQEKDRVYILNVNFFRSDDAGETLVKIDVPHGDNHDLWIDPTNNSRMIQTNDGGANVSLNAGESWTGQRYPTAQMYRVSVSNHFPYFVCGGQQDNSTICVPSRDWNHVDRLGDQYGFAAGGGESGYVTNDPKNHDIFYAGSYGGTLTRFDYSTGQNRRINVYPDNPMGYSAGDIAERFQWTFPIVFDPHDPQTLFVASQHVWRTRNEGQSWERISPDLTRADPITMGPSGGPITLDQTGVETYATVFSLAPSRLERGLIWAASDDGLVHITRDGGEVWTNVTPPVLPVNTKITTIEDSPHAEGTAFLTGHRFLLGDFKPYVLKTSDYGANWTQIASGIPSDEIARSIREDLVRPGLLYLGTERGVWTSFNSGEKWFKLQRNLPAVQVSDLAVTERDLVIGTHGRSFWIMDNIGVLRQLEVGGERGLQLFEPAFAVRGVDEGVAIDYFLPTQPQELKLDILDSAGALIRSFEGKLSRSEDEDKKKNEPYDPSRKEPPPTADIKAGLNRFTWDMRYPGFTEFPGMVLWTSSNRGIMAVPGQYQVRLTVDGETLIQSFEIRLDPRVTLNDPSDPEARFELASAISAKVSEANEAVLLIRGVKQQVEALGDLPEAGLADAVTALVENIGAIEGRIYQVRNQSRQDPLNYPIMLNDKLAGLIGTVEGAEAPPTDQTYEVFARLSAALDTELAALENTLDTQLPALNARLVSAGFQPVVRAPLEAVEAPPD